MVTMTPEHNGFSVKIGICRYLDVCSSPGSEIEFGNETIFPSWLNDGVEEHV